MGKEKNRGGDDMADKASAASADSIDTAVGMNALDTEKLEREKSMKKVTPGGAGEEAAEDTDDDDYSSVSSFEDDYKPSGVTVQQIKLREREKRERQDRREGRGGGKPKDYKPSDKSCNAICSKWFKRRR